MTSSQTPITIDCQYLYPKFAASFLLVEGHQGAFIENNTAHSVPLLLEELQKQKVRPENVEYLIVTHIHLDHAGGTHALSLACPNAKILAHPKAAPHLIDPTKLVNSARKVYGDEVFEKLYGEIKPIPSERVQIVEDGEKIPFGKRILTFFYTRGHANHHFCVFDDQSRGVFTGDSFGIAYPLLQKKELFIFPTTSPTDFDPTEAKISVQKILDTRAERAFLTHYGEIGDLKKAAEQLLFHLSFSEKLLLEAISSGEPDEELTPYCEKKLMAFFRSLVESKKLPFGAKEWEILDLDLKINAAGIAHAARKKRANK